MDVQHAVITGGGGSLAAAMMRAMSTPLWQLEAPTRSELDVTDAAAVDAYFKDRPIDLLVCAAGAVADAPLARMGEESWDHIFAVNYQGAADCAAAVLPTMLRQQRGHIILISSHSALHPPTGQAAYASAKAALLGLNATLARRYGRHNIRVNTLLPGFIESRITEAVSAKRKSLKNTRWDASTMPPQSLGSLRFYIPICPTPPDKCSSSTAALREIVIFTRLHMTEKPF
jgi:3-oxoacyl-[acyl-carrier protein] reductase